MTLPKPLAYASRTHDYVASSAASQTHLSKLRAESVTRTISFKGFQGSTFMGIPVINFKLIARRLRQIVNEIQDFVHPERIVDNSWRNPRVQQFVVTRAVVRSVGRPKMPRPL
jgi:hypothetical protein